MRRQNLSRGFKKFNDMKFIHHAKEKNKKFIIISITVQHYDKFKHPFMIKK